MRARASAKRTFMACEATPGKAKPGTGIDFNTMVDREADRMRKDEKYVAQCMRAKGYSDAAN